MSVDDRDRATEGPKPIWYVARVFTRSFDGLWLFVGHETVAPGDTLAAVRARVAIAEGRRACDVRAELIR
jgi:hypothetical protein